MKVIDSENGLALRIQERLAAVGKDPTPASVEAGLSPSTIRNIFEGKSKSPRGKTLSALARVLETTEYWLLHGDPAKAPPLKAPPPAQGDLQMPVYAAAEGGPGEMVVDTDPIDYVARPWYLGAVKNSYAVRVVGESMVHAYEPGDIVIINPKLEHARNKNHIFIGGEEHGEYRASIKRLSGWSDTEWQVEQFNPPKKFNLPKKEWPKALRIVGKYEA